MSKKDGVTRLRKELGEFYKDPPPFICVAVNERNIFEWEYLLQGPPDTPYEGGEYHGRLRFPQAYPQKPPEIVMFTPNGRFETSTPLCLSMSSFHPESWNPVWSVATILKGLLSFMVEDTHTAGSIQPAKTDTEKRVIAGKTMEANRANPTYRKFFPDGFILPEKEDKNTKTESAPEADEAPVEKEEGTPVAPETPEAATESKTILAPGAKVTIKAMTLGNAKYNGMEAEVVGQNGLRWEVKVEGKVIKVKETNLA